MRLALTGNEPRQRYLFEELRRTTDVVAELPFDEIDPLTKYLAAALSFATPREEWWGNYQMHPIVQRRRRRVLNRGIRGLDTSIDALLMWGSWFNPNVVSKDGASLPFFIYIDPR